MKRFPFLGTLLSIAILSIVACSGKGTTPGVTTMSMPKSVSPASIQAPPMAHTAILSPSVMAVKPQGAVQDASYTQLPGTGSYAAAAPDGSLWVLSDQPSGPDKFIWHYADGTWTNISGEASQIAVGLDGTLYAINSGGGTYAYSGGNWTALGGGASAIATVADGSFYVLSNGNSPGSDQAIWHNVGGTWTQVPGEGVSIAGNFDTGSYAESGGTVRAGGLYIVNSLGAIYYENTDDSFVQLPSNASALAPTTVGGVYALGYPSNANGNNLYYYDLDAQTWSVQSGAGVSISSGDGTLYVIASTGAIYSTPVTSATAPAANVIQNGDFETGSLAPWTACSYQHIVTGYTAPINPSPTPAPDATASQPPVSTGSPSPVLTGSGLTPFVSVTAPPANYNPNNLDTPTGDLGNYSALTGSLSAQINATTGICQTVTVPTGGLLSFWVYEGGTAYNFYNGDQEAQILDSTGTTVLKTLFVELNCYYDQVNLGEPAYPSSGCFPSTYGSTSPYTDWQGGYWVPRGPYDLSSLAGQTVTLFLGVWTDQTHAGPTSYANFMFVDNVQLVSGGSVPITIEEAKR